MTDQHTDQDAAMDAEQTRQRLADVEAQLTALHARIRDVEIRNRNLRTRLASETEARQLAVAEIRRLEQDLDRRDAEIVGYRAAAEQAMVAVAEMKAATGPVRRHSARRWG